MEYKSHPERILRHWVSAPFIYIMILPLLMLDLFLELYHQICFRLYAIPRIPRGDYIKIDRHKLKYLRWFDKINCAYCGYANGLAAYCVAIAGETEKYWCGIKHNTAARPSFHEPMHQKEFVAYGDKEAYEKRYCKLVSKKKTHDHKDNS
jgi:hypothetical protein